MTTLVSRAITVVCAGNARSFSLDEGHRRGGRLNFDPAIPLPDVDRLSAFEPEALAKGLRDHDTSGTVDGGSISWYENGVAR